MPLRKPVQNHQIYRIFKEQNVRSWAEMFGSGQIQAKIGLFKICHPKRSRAATQPRDLRLLRRLHNRRCGGKDTARPRMALRIREMIAAIWLQ
jgi:hypothetical protein